MNETRSVGAIAVRLLPLAGSWMVLALVLWSQDRVTKGEGAEGERPTVCEHGREVGLPLGARPLDLNQVEKTYFSLMNGFRELVQARQEGAWRPPGIHFKFDSGLRRSVTLPRSVPLPNPLPKTLVGARIYVGEVEDLVAGKRREEGARSTSRKGHGAVAYLVVRAGGLEDLRRARDVLEEPIGLATPELCRFFGLESFPVRVAFEGRDRASIESIE